MGQPFRENPAAMENVSRLVFGINNVRNNASIASVDMVFVLLQGVSLNGSGEATITVPDFMEASTVGYIVLKKGTLNGSRQLQISTEAAASEFVDVLVFGMGYQLKGA